MKKIISIFTVLVVALMLSLSGWAQDETGTGAGAPPVPRWVSEKGYWQVESNVRTPDNFTIYFFNNAGVLVYKEHVEGVKLHIDRRKTRMRLKEVLERSVIAWEENRQIGKDETLVAAAFRGNGRGR